MTPRTPAGPVVGGTTRRPGHDRLAWAPMSAKNPRPARDGRLPTREINVTVRESGARAMGVLYTVLAVAWIPLVVWSFTRDVGPLVVVWMVLAVGTAVLAWFALSTGSGTLTLGPQGATRSGMAGWKLGAAEIADVHLVQIKSRWVVRIGFTHDGGRARGVSLASGLSHRIDPMRGSSQMVSIPVKGEDVETARAVLTAQPLD